MINIQSQDITGMYTYKIGYHYMKNFKMNHFKNGVAEHGICPILCTVSHWVKASITTPNKMSHILELLNESCLIRFPVASDYWKQKISLMGKKCSCGISWQTHVPKNKQHFADRRSCQKNCKAQQNISSSMFSSQCIWLWSPLIAVITTFWTMLVYNHQCPTLLHCHSWFTFLAFKAK